MFNQRGSLLAILLQEEGLYHCRIYATDMNETVLRKPNGIFPVGLMQDYTQHYLKAGGKRSFQVLPAYDNAIFPSFRKTCLFPT